MGKEVFSFRAAGLRFGINDSALVGFIVLTVVFAGIGLALLNLSAPEAIIGGVLATLIHFVSEGLHQVGHSIAARRTGYPMIGVQHWLILGTALYPRDEGDLPAAVHIRRALGGPIMSFVVAAVFGLMVLLLAESGGLAFWLALWGLVVNLLIFGLGAFLPLPLPGGNLTDGGTILYWMRRRN